MTNAKAKNDVRVILENYLDNENAAKVAEILYAVMQSETQHKHNGRMFFVHEDSNGELVFTGKSRIMQRVQMILSQHLEADAVEKCLNQLTGKSDSTETKKRAWRETFLVEGSASKIYLDLFAYTPATNAEREFLENLREAIEAGVKPFEVPVFDPSIIDGYLIFTKGQQPAVGYSYNQLEEIASKNGLQLGSKNMYILFLATIIHHLVESGMCLPNAVRAVCCDSTELGNYRDHTNGRYSIERTGSKGVAGKYDLGNLSKILAKDKNAGGYWIAGGDFWDYGNNRPLAHLELDNAYDFRHEFCVGWFVL